MRDIVDFGTSALCLQLHLWGQVRDANQSQTRTRTLTAMKDAGEEDYPSGAFPAGASTMPPCPQGYLTPATGAQLVARRLWLRSVEG